VILTVLQNLLFPTRSGRAADQPLDPGQPVVRFSGVSRAFGDTVAVDRVDLEVAEHEIVALLGPSGCGKTTLLRLLAGFLAPDAGSVQLAGQVIAGDGVMVRPEDRHIGMVFQDFALFPHLDVATNIGFGLPRRTTDRAGRIAELVEVAGLQGLQHRHPHELSGGQQQRVALARALAPRPRVVLLDEPFSNLDAALRAQVRADVRRILTEQGMTAIVVTHDQDEALSLADRVVVMNGGRVLQSAAPQEVYRQPADSFVARFVGDSNLLRVPVAEGAATTEFGSVDLTGQRWAGHPEVQLAVRPEDILATPADHGASQVVWREFYGHDQVLHVRTPAGATLRVRTDSRSDLAPGDRCELTLIGTPVAYQV
jgi:iron(III) transport system ATP-binding protein